MDTRQASRIRDQLLKVFSRDQINQTGRAVGFMARLRQVTPFRLVVSLITTLASRRVQFLADLFRGFNADTGLSVRQRPLHRQLCKSGFPELMREVCCQLLGALSSRVLEPLPDSVVEPFDDIVIQDGSSFALPDVLADVYPGRFTSNRPAAVELHATMSLFEDQAVQVWLAPDVEHERQFLPTPASLSGKLLLADRGYLDFDYMAELANSKASFIFRAGKYINPLVTRCHSATEQELLDIEDIGLKELMPKLAGATADFDVVCKSTDGRVVSLRMVVLPPKKKRARRKGPKRGAAKRTRQRETSKDQFALLVTNLPRDDYTVSDLQALYSLRWQVEILFKEWKSHSNLHAYGTSKPEIAEGLIWASICAAILKRFIAHATEQLFHGIRMSTQRTASSVGRYLKQFAEALLAGDSVDRILRRMFRVLSTQANRAHPKLDRRAGRLSAGLQHVEVPAVAL